MRCFLNLLYASSHWQVTARFRFVLQKKKHFCSQKVLLISLILSHLCNNERGYQFGLQLQNIGKFITHNSTSPSVANHPLQTYCTIFHRFFQRRFCQKVGRKSTQKFVKKRMRNLILDQIARHITPLQPGIIVRTANQFAGEYFYKAFLPCLQTDGTRTFIVDLIVYQRF